MLLNCLSAFSAIDSGGHTIPSGFPVGENFDVDSGVLHLRFDQHAVPIACEIPSLAHVRDNTFECPDKCEMKESAVVSDVEMKRLLQIAKYDSLQTLSTSDKVLLWKKRYYCKNIAKVQ